MPDVYDIGDQPTVTATFTAADGETLESPSTVTVKVIEPNGTQRATVTTPAASITNPSTGVFAYTFPAALDQSGVWRVKFQGTAGLIAAEEIEFMVRRTSFT
jgi:hypothetical protein